MHPFIRLSLLCLTAFGLSLVSVGRAADSPAFDPSSIEFFEKEVRPILANRCFECHGEKGEPKGGLRLDSRDAVLKGGDTGAAVVLDKPAESLFVSSINYGDIYQMPPKSKLPPSEIAVLTKWVEMGIPWPKEAAKAGTVKPFDLVARASEHWCWQPPKPVQPPTVTNAAWPLSDVDRFILAKLEAKGLTPAEAADRRTLIRRVYFDLIGLPPSPDEVERFVADSDPKAYEKVVDGLLGSVHFGERWARHWLDLARYAETRGHEFEPIIPNAWQYRDYVIRAFNADVPYDRFLKEQVAGDLIEPRWRTDTNSNPSGIQLPINESLLGTGFWFLGEEVHSPVDIRKDETDRIDNRLDVMTKTFLGLTVGCARCHDHKFDAISQRDYYALAGFAISSSYRQARVDTMEQHRQIAVQLDEQREKVRRDAARLLVEQSKPVLDQLDAYWVAAGRLIDSNIGVTSLTDADFDNPEPVDAVKSIRQLATEKGLDPVLLGRWSRELKNARENARHPLHALHSAGTPSSTGVALQGSTDSKPVAPPNPNDPIPGLVVDFGDPGFNFPMQDGVSFGLRPVARGQLSIDESSGTPQVSVATIGGWQRDLFWRGLKLAPGTETDHGTLGAWQLSGRMVRSPEFTLAKRHLWYLVRGSVHVYASVNSHLIVVGPLHGSVFREYKHTDDQWHWVSHDLTLYSGHRMHIEFAPADDGPCSVAMVVQGDEQPAFPDLSGQRVVNLDPAGISSGSDRLAMYHTAVKQAVQSLVAGPRNLSDTNDPSNATSVSHTNATQPAGLRHWDQVRFAHWFVSHPALFSRVEFKVPKTGLSDVEAEAAKHVQWESRLAPVMQEGNGVDEFLLVRGNSNTPKEVVPRRFLDAVHHVQNQNGADHSATSGTMLTGSGRKELAEEMLRSPLASRVAVNRIWHHLFGRGIVPTVDNMGVLGLPPTHSELLDHLAIQFVQDGWSIKRMIRSLVLSQTYRMSSHPTEADAADPDNEWWHRMPIKRLQGEVIRDALLSVSGRLDPTPFGPSVPIHLTEFMQGRGRPGNSGPLDGNGRRSIYIAVRRNFLSPMMLAFDTPSPFSTVGRRTVSNVPAQALILMNDPFVIEQARGWAGQLLSNSALTTEQRLDRLYLTAFARHPNAAETSEAMAFLNSQGAGDPANARGAWEHLCHVMFNVKEFVFIE